MKFKKGLDPNQTVLIPQKASDYLPENHLAKIIYEIVDNLDISSIEEKYSELGQNAYNPKMMIRILFYHYSIGICSSRKIQNSCYERLDTKYLADGLTPSHDRISDFRKDNLEEIKDLFAEIVLIGKELGLIKHSNINVALDGSKQKAHASSKLSKTEDEFLKLNAKIEEEIASLLEKAEKIDEIEDKEKKNKILKKIKSKKSRIESVKKAIKKLKQKKEIMKHNIQKEKRRALTSTEIKKIEEQKLNSTDNDAKFMKQRNGLIKPAYNTQVVADEEEQFILANDVTDDCNDQHQLILLIEQTLKNVKSIKKVKGDNGYFPELGIAKRLYPEIEFYIDDKNRRKNEIDFNDLIEKYDKEELANLINLLTDEGKEEYIKRMFTVEPIFGNLKENTGIKTFLLRGIRSVKGEFNLMCIGHNLKKIASFVNKNNIPIDFTIQKLKEMKKKVQGVKRNISKTWIYVNKMLAEKVLVNL